MGLYRVGDEKRVRWGKSLFIEAISNVDPAQRYPMCELLLDRECVLDAGTKDGTNPFHILSRNARTTSPRMSPCVAASSNAASPSGRPTPTDVSPSST